MNLERGMRGEAQIRAAARDDQETANRNGMKAHWRREKLGTLLDKLEEEVKEFVKDVMEYNREGIRWEGSDVRWTVDMIQDHHGVLELAEEQDAGVEQRIVQLEEARQRLNRLPQAMREQKDRWLNVIGSGDAQTRSGYIEAMNWAIDLAEAALSSFRASEAPEEEGEDG